MPALYRLQVYDIKISELFNAMGTVGRPMTRLQREIYLAAIAEAPLGSTGEIKRSHENRGSLKAGPYRTRGFISNDAPHASYVYNGTYGPITPRAHSRLKFRGRDGRFVFPKAVRGQRANPWMERAAGTVLSRHGIPHT